MKFKEVNLQLVNEKSAALLALLSFWRYQIDETPSFYAVTNIQSYHYMIMQEIMHEAGFDTLDDYSPVADRHLGYTLFFEKRKRV